jgi:hypothetical protein
MHRIGIAVAIASCAIAAAGCGGGSSSKSQSPADFRANVTKLCTDAKSKLSSIDQPKSDKDVSSYLSDVKKVASPYVDNLDAVNAPKALAGPYDALVSLNRQELTLLDRAKKAVDDGDTQKAAQIIQQDGQRLSTQEDAKWKQLGVPKCAS